MGGSAAAAASGSALTETGPFGPIDRPCARRFAGDWTADGMSCPPRREHLIIRLQVSPGAVISRAIWRSCRCCSLETRGSFRIGWVRQGPNLTSSSSTMRTYVEPTVAVLGRTSLRWTRPCGATSGLLLGSSHGDFGVRDSSCTGRGPRSHSEHGEGAPPLASPGLPANCSCTFSAGRARHMSSWTGLPPPLKRREARTSGCSRTSRRRRVTPPTDGTCSGHRSRTGARPTRPRHDVPQLGLAH